MTPLPSEGVAERRTVSSNLYQDLVFYFKYASSAYNPVCPRPNGNHMVFHFSNAISDIQGFVARDTDRKEIVVSLRGSTSITEFLLDTQILLLPFFSPGVSAPPEVRVHTGFLADWNSVALQVISTVTLQLERYPDYSIVTTGHSLGGSMSILAAVALQQNFPNSQTRAYSYGAPRTGNKAFAEFVNELLRDRSFRAVHAKDGVPTIIPTCLGYHHHGVEYWQKEHPPSAETTIQCSPDGEDPTCSASVPSGGINLAHLTYFGIAASTPFCL